MNTSTTKDIHSFRMQKKIAQLTNVIFELHTLHDEHQQEIDELKNIHEAEITQIVASYQSSINSLKKQLKQQDVETIIQKQSVKFQHEFQAYKTEMMKKETSMKDAFQKKISDLIEEIDDKKDSFHDRITEFSTKLRNMQDNNLEEIKQLKKQHEIELQNLTHNSNKRYNDMYASMIEECENYKKQLNDANSKIEKVNLINDSLQSTITNLTNEMITFKQNYNLSSKEVDSLKSNEILLNQNIQNIIKQLNEKDDNINLLKTELKNIESVSNLHIDEIKNLNLKIKKFKDLINTQLNELNILKSQLSNKDKEIENMNEIISSKMNQINLLNDKISQLQQSISMNTGNYEENLENLKLSISTLKEENNFLKSNIDNLNNQLLQSNNYINEKDIQINKLSSEIIEINKICDDKNSKINELETTLLNYKLEIENDKLKLNEQASLSYKQDLLLQQLQDDVKMYKEQSISNSKMLQELKNNSQIEIELLKNKLNEEIVNLNNQINDKNDIIARFQSQTQLSSQSRSDLLKQIDLLKEEKANLIKEMRDETLKLKKEYEDKLINIQEKLNSAELQNQGLQDQLANIRIQWEIEIENSNKFKNEINCLTSKISILENEHFDKIQKLKNDYDLNLIEMKNSLQSKFSTDLEDALNNQKKKFTEDKFNEIKNLENQKLNHLNLQRDEFLSQISKLENEINQHKQNKFQLEETIEILNQDILKERQNFETKLKHEKELQIDLMNKSLKNTESTFNDIIQNIELKHENQLFEINKNKDKKLQDQLIDFQEKTLKMKIYHEEELNNLKNKLTDEFLKNKLESIQELEKKLKNDFDSKIIELKQKHSQETQQSVYDAAETKRELMSHIKHWSDLASERQHNIESLTLNIEQITLKNTQLQEDVKLLNETIIKIQEEHSLNLKSQKENMIKEANLALQANIDQNNAELQKFEELLLQKEQQWVQEKQNLISEISLWQNKFENRESRLEDIERIQILERVLIEKESILRKAIQDIKYFKLELINREDSYNKTFGRTNPNVGVINPLAAKKSFQNQSIKASKTQSQNNELAINPNIDFNNLSSDKNQLQFNTNKSPMIQLLSVANSEETLQNSNEVQKYSQSQQSQNGFKSGIYDTNNIYNVQSGIIPFNSRKQSFNETIPPFNSDKIFVKTNQLKLPPINKKISNQLQTESVV